MNKYFLQMDKLLILNDIKKHLGIRFDKDFADFLGVKTTTLAMWYKRNSYDVELLFNKCEFLNPEWLLTGKGEMLRISAKPYPDAEKAVDVVEEDGEMYKKLPLVEVKAIGGFGGADFSIQQKDVKEYYIIPKFRHKQIDFMIEVEGSSMYPKYNSGDVVACTVIKERNFIQWNKTHVVATRSQGIIIKRIKQGNDGNLLMVSDNPSYDPFEVPVDEVLDLAIVAGVIRLE